ncbi:TOBE domain-containing protein [Neorhizobium sp. R1-B]|nr:TOBE domain-containing protein [Neorhizobium sp. R1-B]
MGRAIVRNPAVFLFDEPLSNLAAKLRVQMRAEIKQLHQRLRTTTVYVTHDQVEAMTMADRIVVLRDGVIEQIGTPLELYDDPANEFVAGFMGSPAMNFIRGEMTEGGFKTKDGLLLPAPTARLEAITYGIRPEHLRIDPAGIPFTVSVVEPMGSETQVVGNIGSQEVTALFRERVRLSPGETISIAPVAETVHLFGRDGLRAA